MIMTALVTQHVLPQKEQETSLPVRKRTRATADQLTVLEDTFAINTSPNAKLRKQLAEQLEMSERSIQIWFQNRRAKVKHMQKRAQIQIHQASVRAQLYGQYNPYYQTPEFAPVPSYLLHTQHSPSPSSSGGVPSLSPSPMIDPSLILALEEDRWPVASPGPTTPLNRTIDPSHLSKLPKELYLSTTALTIGSWHRLQMTGSDLVCVFCPDTLTFAWHIVDGGCHFKITLALDSLSSIEYEATAGQIHFDISEPPLFSMEQDNRWIQCSDFTQGKQASRFFRHTLQGNPHHLQQELFTLIQTYPHTRRLVHFLDPSHNPNALNTFWPPFSCLAIY
ncbi:hypothetical protein BY458DRAFT_527265 [Sporodiniella umbellata]|nr:hypothetical protein BY458DRAFT_527265 [Sporodiniella umbellata]